MYRLLKVVDSKSDDRKVYCVDTYNTENELIKALFYRMIHDGLRVTKAASVGSIGTIFYTSDSEVEYRLVTPSASGQGLEDISK